jgi:2-iminobutanoate/2-iminopropanoate deaminase
MSEIGRIFPTNAPTPRGPYSPAVQAGDFIFVSGQGPVDPVTDKLVFGPIEDETRRTLTNIKVILAAAGATLADVVQVRVFLKDPADFAAMNSVYTEFFGEQKPARTTVGTMLPNPEMKIEIDCVAYKAGS